jgi:hypothetical protein
MRYWPSSFVTPDFIFSMSAGLLASTVTPGRTAPLESLTTPAMALCASAGRPARNITRATSHNLATAVFIMASP